MFIQRSRNLVLFLFFQKFLIVSPCFSAEKSFQLDESAKLKIQQNRIYLKANRFDLGVAYGIMNNDAFLSSTSFSGYLGYNLNEVFEFSLMFSSISNRPSTAAVNLEKSINRGANTNPLSWTLTGELTVSALYGKLSLLDRMIVHYDLFLTGGVSSVSAMNGNVFGPEVGIGERMFINKSLCLRLDYRFLYFQENIVERIQSGPTLGKVIGTRNNFTSVLTFGLNFLI